MIAAGGWVERGALFGALPIAAERRGPALTVVLLGVAVVLLLVEPLIALPLPLPRNYNEGWNAYHALRALGAGQLYPEPSALITNNYPPLSFYIVGGLGAVIGDNIIAGRIVALISLLVVALNLGLIVRHMGGSRIVAAFGGLLFLGYAIVHSAHIYIAVNDPQWLGHALMTTGLVVLLRGRGTAAVVGAAALMLAAGLVKHLLLPLPLAVTVWLAVHDRRRFKLWLGASLALLALALIGLHVAYGSNFFAAVLGTDREYHIGFVAKKLDAGLVPLIPAIGASVLLLFLNGRDRHVQLVTLYGLFAGLWCAFTWGARGVEVNAAFDLLIAVFIGAALAAEQLGMALAPNGPVRPPARVCAMVILALMVLLPLPDRLVQLRDFLRELPERRASFAAGIAFIATQEGRAACEQLALCYWAGKTFEIDVFSTGQKLFTGALDEEEFNRLLDDHYFAVVQLHGGEGEPYTPRLPEAVTDRLVRAYAVRRVSPTGGGAFLTPRAASESAATVTR